MEERIKEIRKQAGMTQQEFADRLNVSKNNIVNYEGGRRNPSAAVIQLICREFNVNAEWLETGAGDMYAPQTKNQQIAAFVNSIMADQDESFRKDLIYNISTLSPEGWSALETLVKEWKGKK